MIKSLGQMKLTYRTIKRIFTIFRSDSLIQNSVYLILSTAAMAGFGFFFWLINAKIFSELQVGIATTLISVATLISSLSQLGLGNSIIKYLPNSDDKNGKINTSFTIIILISILSSTIFLTILPHISIALFSAFTKPVYYLLYVVFTTLLSLSIFSDNIFIAYRKSFYVLIKNILFSITKLILPVILVTLGAYGIFISFGMASLIAFIAAISFISKITNYRFKLTLNKLIIRRILNFSLVVHASTFISTLPTLVLPVLISNYSGPQFSAYFYIDMMIANLLYVIPTAITNSFFAEGSNNTNEIKNNLKKAINFITIILIPSIMILIFLSKFILSFFGNSYFEEGVTLLHMLLISSVFISFNLLVESLLKINHKINILVKVNIAYAISTLFLSYALIILYGLNGVGIAFIISNALVSFLYAIVWKRENFSTMLV